MKMAFNKLLGRQQVIEAYQIPKELEQEIFLVLRPVFGTGDGAMYQESLVDQQLHHYGLKKLRLREPDTEYSHKEDSKMARHATWADTVEDEEPSLVAELPPLLVDEETAGQLLGISKRMVFDLEERGLLKSKRIGKLKRYAVSHLREFAEGKVA
jgi:hypothetical protein